MDQSREPGTEAALGGGEAGTRDGFASDYRPYLRDNDPCQRPKSNANLLGGQGQVETRAGPAVLVPEKCRLRNRCG
jgi:hypothetical protein